jgi:hypothetical protein
MVGITVKSLRLGNAYVKTVAVASMHMRKGNDVEKGSCGQDLGTGGGAHSNTSFNRTPERA